MLITVSKIEPFESAERGLSPKREARVERKAGAENGPRQRFARPGPLPGRRQREESGEVDRYA